MRAKSILLFVLVFIAIVGELVSYSMSTLLSRIILVIAFLALFLAAILAHNLFGHSKSPYGKSIIFAVFFIISLLFLLRRYILFSPSFMESLLNSERFALAEGFNASGFIIFNTTHSFIFQHPLLLSFFKDAMGIPLSQVVYVTLMVHVTIVASAGVIFYEAFRKRFNNKEGFGFALLPPLIVFSLISFAYSERTEIALPLLFLLMSFIFGEGFTDRRKVVVILVLVTGITLGSSTAILIMIPFFFIYALFARKITSLIFGLIPLAYLLFVGYSYSISIRYYVSSSIQGVQGFINQLLGGQVPERVIPWQRLVLPLAGDIQVASATYLSLLLVSAFVSLLGLFVWLKYRMFRGGEKNALFNATLITLLFALGLALFVYVGASFNPESTSSDIRTIAIVFITLLLPFLFLSKNLLKSIKARKIVLLIVASLLLIASLRTFYEPYPISSNDPVNLVEDVRIDSFAVGSVGDFLRNSGAEGSIAFDYKTGPRVANFLSDDLQPMTFTSELPESDYVVFDVNGLKLGSLHTTLEAYEEASNLTLYENVVYSNGNVIVIQRVD